MMIKMPEHTLNICIGRLFGVQKERLDAQGFGLNNFEKIFNDEMVQAVDYSSFCIIYRRL